MCDEEYQRVVEFTATTGERPASMSKVISDKIKHHKDEFEMDVANAVMAMSSGELSEASAATVIRGIARDLMAADQTYARRCGRRLMKAISVLAPEQ